MVQRVAKTEARIAHDRTATDKRVLEDLMPAYYPLVSVRLWTLHLSATQT